MIAVLFVTLTISHLLIPLFNLPVPVKNPEIPGSNLWAAVMIPTAIMLVLVYPRPALVVLLGIMLGGAASNFIDRVLFGPVSDYILLPGSGNLYFNFPDLMIVIGPILFVFMVIKQGFWPEEAIAQNEV